MRKFIEFFCLLKQEQKFESLWPTLKPQSEIVWFILPAINAFCCPVFGLMLGENTNNPKIIESHKSTENVISMSGGICL